MNTALREVSSPLRTKLSPTKLLPTKLSPSFSTNKQESSLLQSLNYHRTSQLGLSSRTLILY